MSTRRDSAKRPMAEQAGAHATLRLAAQLDGYDLAGIHAMANRAGVEPKLARRAWRGRPINASAYLKLCAALGIDPLAFDAVDGDRIGNISYASLGIAVTMYRLQHQLTLRDAAVVLGVSYVTVSRIERAQSISVGSLLVICKGMGRLPGDFVAPLEKVSRVTDHCNKDSDAVLGGGL